ncbi:MAG: AI-2E family transporter YdiK [Anaeromyxobacteraceae bacterium]
MNSPPPATDLARITLGVLALLAMIASSLWVMLPFLLSVVWAAAIVIATWPILIGLQARLGGRRGLAVGVMTAAMIALIAAPIWLGTSALVENAGRIGQTLRTLGAEGFPPAPSWLERVPVVGGRLAARWQAYSGHPEAVIERLEPHAKELAGWVAARAGGVGTTIVQLLLMVIVSGLLYASGESVARGVLRFLRRLAGDRGENSGLLAAKAIRAVALGVIVTAVAQTILAAAGLFLAGVPQAGLLSALVFVLCIAQIGPILVVLPATIWLYSSGAVGRGTVLLVISIVALTLDNVIRPILIKKGADLPLVLILSGVIGGVMALGVIGLFVGPVLLAVTWTLLAAWVGDVDGGPTALEPKEHP